ncbi:MAG: HAD hydrolase family protein [Epsilonproteobacteria bacterium]|nr:HAD hydrolase family protein [Campylobacterota bacterium]
MKLLVLDVDGCLSDGKITYTSNCSEIKSFDVKDGFAIVQWQRMGKSCAIISGRKSKVVELRAKELGIKHLYQEVWRKEQTLLGLCEELGIPLSEVAAIGDDLNDYRLLKKVGLSFAPSNAVPQIKEIVDIVLGKEGGNGAIREMIEILLKREGLFEEYCNFWIN